MLRTGYDSPAEGSICLPASGSIAFYRHLNMYCLHPYFFIYAPLVSGLAVKVVPLSFAHNKSSPLWSRFFPATVAITTTQVKSRPKNITAGEFKGLFFLLLLLCCWFMIKIILMSVFLCVFLYITGDFLDLGYHNPDIHSSPTAFFSAALRV